MVITTVLGLVIGLLYGMLFTESRAKELRLLKQMLNAHTRILELDKNRRNLET